MLWACITFLAPLSLAQSTMAHSFLRLRRALPPVCNIRHRPLLNTSISSSLSSQHTSSYLNSVVQSWRSYSTCLPFLLPSFDPVRDIRTRYQGMDLFHWHIMMLLPMEAELTPEDILGIYEETCAKGLNISLEEAKQRIYACTISRDFGMQGFRVVMRPRQRFRFYDLPYVLSVKADYYVDREKREYGGEFKYINGAIMPKHGGSLQNCSPQRDVVALGREEIGCAKPINNRDEVHVF